MYVSVRFARLLLRAQFREDAEIFQRRRVAGHRFSAGDFLEQSPHDFSAARFRQCLGEPDLVRLRDRANVNTDVFAPIASARGPLILRPRHDKGDVQ